MPNPTIPLLFHFIKTNTNTIYIFTAHTTKSLNAPIAAFTMAILLCSYCISSIRSARREAQTQNLSGPPSQSQQAPSNLSGKEQSWVQQALEESRAGKTGEGKGSR